MMAKSHLGNSPAMEILKYLAGYSENIQNQVIKMIDSDKLNDYLLNKYHFSHEIKTKYVTREYFCSQAYISHLIITSC